MKEDYLHYVWQKRKLITHTLFTTEGLPIEVLDRGTHNFDAGPDFLNAKVRIGDQLWFGSIEIHIRSSDWNNHKHQEDARYNNVILHVVYDDNKQVLKENGHQIPTLEIQHLIDHNAYFYYEQFQLSKGKLACADQIRDVNQNLFFELFHEKLLERWNAKMTIINDSLNFHINDWELVIIELIARYLGTKINAEFMVSLIRRLPAKLFKGSTTDLGTIEAILLGVAGMLKSDFVDDYEVSLKSEYLFQKQKCNLKEMSGMEWKYSRMRPHNFPDVRIAQLATMIISTRNMFQIVKDKLSRSEIELIFDIEASSYWSNHYRIGKVTKTKTSKIGSAMVQSIIINVIAPLSFAYGNSIKDDSYGEYALKLLNEIPSEQNKYAEIWKEHGVNLKNASQSQGSLHQYVNYCSKKKCLECKIGLFLLRNKE